MAISGIAAAASYQTANLPATATSAHRRHGNHQSSAISDVDAQSSSLAGAGGPAGKTGGLLDVTA